MMFCSTARCGSAILSSIALDARNHQLRASFTVAMSHVETRRAKCTLCVMWDARTDRCSSQGLLQGADISLWYTTTTRGNTNWVAAIALGYDLPAIWIDRAVFPGHSDDLGNGGRRLQDVLPPPICGLQLTHVASRPCR